MFNYDWFHGASYQQQVEEAVWRCTHRHFGDIDESKREKPTKKITKFASEVEVRTLIYLRDGFSYEVQEMADVPSRSHLVFECVPVDEHYKVGAFVVTVPFEEIVRVEVFAVHPTEKPNDSPQITGFRTYEPIDHKHVDAKPPVPAR